jgi:hypothetical protein
MCSQVAHAKKPIVIIIITYFNITTYLLSGRRVLIVASVALIERSCKQWLAIYGTNAQEAARVTWFQKRCLTRR